ncbi:MAG: NB-ARC domain-containing protein [Caldilineaceae bacterium]
MQRLHPELDTTEVALAILNDGLAVLRQEHSHAAEIIEARFLQGLTVAQMVIAQRPVPQSERRFYKQQAAAIERLADALILADARCKREEEIQKHLVSLPLPTYDHLFGVNELVQQVCEILATPNQHHIVSLKGIGGIGKTALADAVTRRLIQDGAQLAGVIWISAKQQFITASGIVGDPTRRRVDEIFQELSQRLGIESFAQLSRSQKIGQLARVLRTSPYLVVIDNLETVADFHQLQPWLNALAGPTKFLLTNREAMPSIENVLTVELNELNQDGALGLIGYTAKRKNVPDVDPRKVYALTGGNPLAIVLLISVMTVLSPRQVLEGMERGSLSDIYTYVYWQAWSVLPDSAKEILFAIQRAGDSAAAAWLSMLHEDEEEVLFAALAALQNLSLIQVQQHMEGQRIYTIHRLTSTFLHTQVLGWK